MIVLVMVVVIKIARVVMVMLMVHRDGTLCKFILGEACCVTLIYMFSYVCFKFSV